VWSRITLVQAAGGGGSRARVAAEGEQAATAAGGIACPFGVDIRPKARPWSKRARGMLQDVFDRLAEMSRESVPGLLWHAESPKQGVYLQHGARIRAEPHG